MKITHANQPRLCDACEELLHVRIEANRQASHQIIPCAHGSFGIVVATVAVRRCQIASWVLHGPVSEEQAAALAASFIGATAALGARIERPAFQ
jgi:hypothetical protein